MANVCPECGTPLPEGKTCLDHFHTMLLLEQEVARDLNVVSGGRGEVAHFYAVSSYVLQHPDSMKYTTEALAGLRQGLSDHLSGKVTLSEQRRRVRTTVNGATRVARRPGDLVIHWPVTSWPLVVTDVLQRGAKDYVARVAVWAQSVLDTLDASGL